MTCPLIDVHLIRYDEPEWQVQRCLESLQDEPIILHRIQGIKEFPPFTKRAEGFACGTAPYVSYVDPDDYVKPGIYKKLLAGITSGDFDAAYGWEQVINNFGLNRLEKLPHHAFVLKRGLALDYTKEWRVFLEIPRSRIAEVNEVVYVHDLGDRK